MANPKAIVPYRIAIHECFSVFSHGRLVKGVTGPRTRISWLFSYFTHHSERHKSPSEKILLEYMLFIPLVLSLALAPTPLLESLRAAGNSPQRSADLKPAVDALLALPEPAAQIDFVQAAGVWRVVNAPHIDTLSSLALTRFDPIEYHIGADGSIASFVRYDSRLFGKGWLCTDGTVSNCEQFLQKPQVRIVWDRIWWAPRDSTRPPRPDEGALADIVQTLGKLGFVEELSVFPVRQFLPQEGVAAFNFQSFTVTTAKMDDVAPSDL